MIRRLAALAMAGALMLAALVAVRSAQNEIVPPTSGVYTGPQFSQLLGDAARSLASCNKGPSAPANVSGAAIDGLCWIDDSVSPWLKKRYANGGWVTEGAIDNINGYWVGSLGGGATSIASAGTVDLGAVPHANVTITGTTTITSFGSTPPIGTIKIIRFAAALVITHSANLKVPGAYPLTTAADDRAMVTHLGSGAWEVTTYTRASGVPVDVSAVGDIKFTSAASAPPLHVLGYGQALTRTTYPAYLARVTRAQNGTRTSGNATIASVADTSGLGAGMPVEGTGINAGCTIASVTASTIVVNSSACVTSSGTATVTVFPTGYGSGGDATTVGVADCGGRMIAGRDDPNGTPLGRITTAGSGINGTVKLAGGGAQTVTIAQANLPNVTLSASGSAQPTVAGIAAKAWNNAQASSNVQSTGSTSVFPANIAGLFDTLTINSTTSSLNGGVTQTAVNKLGPTLIADCAVRVTP